MPVRPQEGMNLHDWATLASVVLLALLIVFGMVFAIMTNVRLAEIEKKSSENAKESSSFIESANVVLKGLQDELTSSLDRHSNRLDSGNKDLGSRVTDLQIQLNNIDQDLKKLLSMTGQPPKSKERSQAPEAIPDQVQEAQISTTPSPLVLP